MKLQQVAFMVLISMGLSSCAYIEGRKDQQTPAVKPAKAPGAKVIVPTGPAQPLPDTAPNPSETASKMITPITKFPSF